MAPRITVTVDYDVTAFPGSPVSTPIKASPTLTADSATVAALLGDSVPVLDVVEYGVSVYTATGQTRYTVALPSGFPDYFDGKQCPLDPAWAATTGDGHMTVIDGDDVWSFYEYDWNGGAPKCSSGGTASLSGDVVTDRGLGNATGSGFSLLAGLITAADIAAGQIDHALVFSTNMATVNAFQFPAKRTDGKNLSGAASTITEGTRIQLDPALDVSALTGHNRMVAEALQTYGAYCIDNGGARIALLVQLPPSGGWTSAGVVSDPDYTAAGITKDYKSVAIPNLGTNLRVLDLAVKV